ncbi:MAG: PilZ domain-containing protein [Candidatus Saccharibacteria bacterium]|nr:PilZ domain-containing protein [Rhodoferax sp.]
MNANPAPENVSHLPFKALGMRSGMALQTRRLVEGASKRESQFFGAIESKGVMVGPMGSDSVNTELEEGEVCVVRGFTGQYEFSFLSKVLQTFEKPFAYALLAYPSQVDARMVRQSLRTGTSWPTQVGSAGADSGADIYLQPVKLIDLSLQGAMVEAPSALGAIGDVIPFTMLAEVDRAPAALIIKARICHNNKSATTEGFFVGLAFKDLKQQEKLLLHYLTQTSQTAQH